MLGALLFVRPQLGFEPFVLGLRPAARPGTGQRVGVQCAILQFDERFRRSARKFDIVTGKVEHIRGGIGRAEHPVGIKQTARSLRGQRIGKHDLKDISLPDVLLGPFDHSAVGFLGKMGCQLGFQPELREMGTCAAVQECFHLIERLFRLCIGTLQIFGEHTGNQQKLLSVMIKDNDLVKQHQVDVSEVVVFRFAQAERRLGVLHIVVREISDQTTGERRHSVQPCSAVILQNRTDCIARMRDLRGFLLRLLALRAASDAQSTVRAGQLECGRIAQKGVAAPTLVAFDAFQQIAVLAGGAQRPHDLDRGKAVGIQCAAEGNATDLRILRDLFHFG